MFSYINFSTSKNVMHATLWHRHQQNQLEEKQKPSWFFFFFSMRCRMVWAVVMDARNGKRSCEDTLKAKWTLSSLQGNAHKDNELVQGWQLVNNVMQCSKCWKFLGPRPTWRPRKHKSECEDVEKNKKQKELASSS